MLVIMFWGLLFCSFYSYLLYPFLLLLLNRSKAERKTPTPVQTAQTYTLIVTVFNEKDRIRRKLDNLLLLQYEPAQLELLVSSDCSDDGTDEIVKEYADRGVRLVRATERLGKENAQMAAIQVASGDILVFSDVATEMDSDAVLKLDTYFKDESVGAVSSEDRIITRSGALAGEGAYVKYEMWLRQQESALGGLVGLSGSFFAARKTVCAEWDIHSPSDFNTALNCVRLGLRSVSAPDVHGYYQDLKDPTKEYARKVRTVLRGMTGLSRHLDVLNVGRFGWFAFQVFSHKLMRWGVPWFLLALLVVSVLLVDQGWVYQAALAGQVAFYAVALLAHVNASVRRIGLAKLGYFFVQVNLAVMLSTVKFFMGTRMTIWKPSSR
ncbi:MAG: glycosyltransferase [Natronospirillum sp.]